MILSRLETAARRGRLPGFTRSGPHGLFSVEAHGHPFEALLIAETAPIPGGGGELRFQLRLQRKLPTVFALTLVATVWPGIYFMDQLIPGEWGFWPTWWWYLPLTALPIPWIWRSLMRRSGQSNRAAALGLIATMAREIGAEVQETR